MSTERNAARNRRRRKQHASTQAPGPSPEHLAKVAAARAAVDVPEITYPEQLPVSAYRDDIAAAIRDNQVVILAGETGSGKTTQLPKILLDLGRGRAGQIGHTQPRRIAARSVAERLASEIGSPLGEIVGYQVRFTDESSQKTLIKVMTDGILLAQIQRDPELLAYDTIIVDEAHERSLNIDFILGYLTRLLPRRPDLKLIITSATIDSDRFAEHFKGADGEPAPVIEVTGRTYPVEIRYRPPLDESTGDTVDQPTAICRAVDELSGIAGGDILVFCSGEREIRDAVDALRGHLGAAVTDPTHPRPIEILPLYSRLSAAEQHRIFQPSRGRRIVVSTNVAETSLTVPGIRYVIDPGTARISRYSKATKVQRLPIEPISQASANQRSGRCGRVADGVAIRLYTEEDYLGRPEFTEPEILRTSLASVILQMVAVGVVRKPDGVADFPFVDRPDVRAVRDGITLLRELGALADTGKLTRAGRVLAALPIDPRLARMIVEANERGVTREVMIIAAALSIQDPRERPTDSRETADAFHARFADPTSDLITWLNLWEYLREQQRELSNSAFRRLCRAEFINFLRVREWQDVVAQLRQMARDLDLKMNPPPKHRGADAADDEAESAVADPTAARLQLTWDADTIHQAILPGLLSNLGMQEATEVNVGRGKDPKAADAGRGRKRVSRNEYRGSRGSRFAIFPGSGLAKRPPAWVMAAELVETSRLWARDVARINPDWIEPAAVHLVKRNYSEPHWSTKQGAAMAYETVLLYGLPVVTRRRVLFGSVEPELAREMFIRHALVQGEWTTHHKFFAENAAVREEAQAIEHRSRQRGLVVDDEALVAFYDERLPASIVSARHFDRWWKDARREDPHQLSLTLDDVLIGGSDVGSGLADGLPEEWQQGDIRMPLSYHFEPGSPVDGVTAHIPVQVLSRVVPDGFDWLVPGLLDELAVATIRALPKPIRVQLVPAPDAAREVVGWLRANEPEWADIVRAGDMAPSFASRFTAAVKALRTVEIPDDAWAKIDEKLPAHLRMNFVVVDDRGMELDSGRDLMRLKRTLVKQIDQAVRTSVRAALDEARATSTTAPPARLPKSAISDEKTGAEPHSRAVSATGGGGIERSGLIDWPADLDALPMVVEVPTGVGMVRGYPALAADIKQTVAVRVMTTEREQCLAHPDGLTRLLVERLRLPDARVTSRWSPNQTLTMASSSYSSTADLVDDLHVAAVRHLLPQALAAVSPSDTENTPEGADPAISVRTKDDFEALVATMRDKVEDEIYRIAGDIAAALAAARDLDKELRRTSSLALLPVLTDIREHVGELLAPGFIAATPPERLGSLVRYVRAEIHRLSRAEENPHKDGERLWQIQDITKAWQRVEAVASVEGPLSLVRSAELADVRWMIEELRVSLFAQQLGTSQPISVKRIHTILRDW